uniref:NADH-ubiquinone oxidoreductase chain 3 n=1 Tax=Molannodes epaphos TaxID=2904896 RepID=A0A9E8LP15_9NEOP|nr:NADH dehydrogenase subunit 3 [Molannodes epaphos]UZZ44175.1 NADH dehydrogenase subunit 3 [Molannodes epaphos]
MHINLINFFIICLISNIMLMICLIISKKKFANIEKLSAFECGFDTKSKARLSFSIHFFLITIIFLIFDVEITLILPMVITWNNTNLTYWLITMMFFMYLLLMGLFYEWNQGMLEWTK